MAAATWPSTLPDKALARGYSESPPSVTLRTSMDAGPAKVRRRFTGGTRPVSVSQILTGDQVEILDTFFMGDLGGGSLAFEWKNPRTGSTVEFRFKNPPRYGEPNGDNWPVSYELEILP